MLIEIESYLGDTLVFGKVRSIGQLKYRMMAVLNDTPTEDFTAIFCARYKFEILPYNPGAQVDYRMDLDTCKVYKPNY